MMLPAPPINDGRRRAQGQEYDTISASGSDIGSQVDLVAGSGSGEETRSAGRYASASRTLINILKAMIGPGCLSLPMAFKFGGLWTGIVLTLIFGAVNTHCMSLLVSSAHFLCDKSGKPDLDYAHLAKKSFDYGPGRFQKHGKVALYVTNVVICCYQIGVGSVQFVFMASNLKQVLAFFDSSVTLGVQTYMSCLLLPVTLVCFIRSFRPMAYISLAGNLCMVIGFVIMFQEIVMPPNEYAVVDGWFHNFQRFTVFMGGILYSFEGQAMILPMENEMKNPSDMIRPMGVMHTSMALTSAIFAATGFYGYLKYGDQIASTLSLSMPLTVPYQVLNVFLISAILAGMPLQNYVIFGALWPAVKRKMRPALLHYSLFIESLFRILVVLLEYAIAMALPNLEDIIPLVGITLGTVISFILPPFIQSITMWDEWRLGLSAKWRYALLAKNAGLMLFGVFAIVVGLYVNVGRLTGYIKY